MISKKLKAIIDILIDNDEEQTPDVLNQNKIKGDMFERYVIDLFNKKYFTVENWTRDIDKNTTGVRVTSNQYPDLTLAYKRKESFAVECKWRKGFFRSERWEGAVLQWSYPDQIKRYQKFEADKGIPVFIVIGVGGEPDDPERMYCLPLSEATYPELFPSYLRNYERDPKKPFFWDGDDLF